MVVWWLEIWGGHCLTGKKFICCYQCGGQDQMPRHTTFYFRFWLSLQSVRSDSKVLKCFISKRKTAFLVIQDGMMTYRCLFFKCLLRQTWLLVWLLILSFWSYLYCLAWKLWLSNLKSRLLSLVLPLCAYTSPFAWFVSPIHCLADSAVQQQDEYSCRMRRTHS